MSVSLTRFNGDWGDVAKNHQVLVNRTDDRRLDLSKVLLTIYTPVSSGLLFLSTNIRIDIVYQEVVFLALVTTSVLIVLSAVIERFGYFLISNHQSEEYVKILRAATSGKDIDKLNDRLDGKKWHTRLVQFQVYIMLALVVLNLFSVLVFVFMEVIGASSIAHT